MRLTVATLVLTCLLVCSMSAHADHTANQIVFVRGPMTISAPGKYVLTQNIRGSSSNFFVIQIEADDVHLDLNGFTVSGAEGGIVAADVSGIVVENGSISAIFAGVQFERVDDFAIRNLSVRVETDAAILVTGRRGVIEDNRLFNDAPSGEDTTSAALAIGICPSSFCPRTEQVRAVQNVITSGGVGLHGVCNACAIEDNTISAIISDGLIVDGRANRVARNIISFADGDGILIRGTGNFVLDNVVGGTEAGSGILIRSTASLIRGNLVSGAGGAGLVLLGSDNVYRANTSRNNNVDFSDAGVNNTSHGDNYMPDRR